MATGLAGQRDDVTLAHLHALGWDSPFRGIEIELGPLRRPELAGPDEQVGRKLERGHNLRLSLIPVQRPQQRADFLALGHGGEVLHPDWVSARP
jgi:hypothetical protein